MPRLIALCFCCMAVVPIRADDAKQVFDSLFQNRIDAAYRSPDRADDLELARQLVTAARESSDTGLVELACDNAYDLTRLVTGGHEVAASAMELLADKVVTRRTDAREKQVEMLMRLSRTGKPADRAQANNLLFAALLKMADERAQSGEYIDAIRVYRQARAVPGRSLTATDAIDWNLALLAQRQRAVKQIETLREKLLADAKDVASADMLIRLHLVDMDDPQGSAKFISQAGDKNLSSIAEAAARPLAELKEDDARKLGQWYWAQAMAAPRGVDTHVLQRARQYLSLYLQLHGETDLSGKAMALQLKEVRIRHRDSAPLIETMLADLPYKEFHSFEGRGVGRDVAVKNEKLSKSLQTHPSAGQAAHVRFELEGKFAVLQGGVGVNDSSAGPHSDLTFIILADGKELWRSKPTRRKNVVQLFQIKVESVDQLDLKVSCRDSAWHAHAVWIEPALYSKSVPAITGKKEFAGIPIDTGSP